MDENKTSKDWDIEDVQKEDILMVEGCIDAVELDVSRVKGIRVNPEKKSLAHGNRYILYFPYDMLSPLELALGDEVRVNCWEAGGVHRYYVYDVMNLTTGRGYDYRFLTRNHRTRDSD